MHVFHLKLFSSSLSLIFFFFNTSHRERKAHNSGVDRREQLLKTSDKHDMHSLSARSLFLSQRRSQRRDLRMLDRDLRSWISIFVALPLYSSRLDVSTSGNSNTALQPFSLTFRISWTRLRANANSLTNRLFSVWLRFPDLTRASH